MDLDFNVGTKAMDARADHDPFMKDSVEKDDDVKHKDYFIDELNGGCYCKVIARMKNGRLTEELSITITYTSVGIESVTAKVGDFLMKISDAESEMAMKKKMNGSKEEAFSAFND